MRPTINRFAMAALVFSLSACAASTVNTTFTSYQDVPTWGKEGMKSLYKLKRWQFSGRMAVEQKKGSWTANIDWQHNEKDDAIKLSGLFGQGATLVRLKENAISIDFGNGKVASSEQAQHYISQQFGLIVPLQALRYWVLGLPDPAAEYQRFGEGFSQYDWVIELERWRWEGVPDRWRWEDDKQLPRKVTVLNRKAKLKLVIDQWDVNNAEAK